MELIDIIIFSLKLFSLASIIVVAISYFVFKVKDRKRVKPYMRQEIPAPISTNFQYQEPETNNSRFQILNDPYTAQNNFSPQSSQEIAFEKPQVISYYKDKPSQSFRREAQTGDYNIYERYSANTFEPMHKIKL